MESVIKWVDMNTERPIDYGWYLAVVKPVNFKDIENEKALNNWIEAFGLEKVWFNGETFWDERCGHNSEITERVIYWAEIPSVPLL